MDSGRVFIERVNSSGYPPKAPPRFAARLPRGYYPSPAWRDTIREINRLLADANSDIAAAFARADRASEAIGDLAAHAEFTQALDRHRDLFPGEAGKRLA